MRIVTVGLLLELHILTLNDDLSIELAVSLNSNDAQIFSSNGQEWVPTETLSEARVLSTFSS